MRMELSEGAAQKIMIASAIAHRPKLLIADETDRQPWSPQRANNLIACWHSFMLAMACRC